MKQNLYGALAFGTFCFLYLIALSACMPRDDGMGELWKGVKHVQENRR